MNYYTIYNIEYRILQISFYKIYEHFTMHYVKFIYKIKYNYLKYEPIN